MNLKMIVGKYTLESLTDGMYSSPLDLYREYIQNSVDSIDDAIENGIVRVNDANIEIIIDSKKSYIKFVDNGCGIPKNIAVRTLLDIGNSNKNRNSNRGFRGIGRLAGLGYCDTLIFTTSVKGESSKTIVRYNAKLLKELMIPGNNNKQSIFDVVDAVITTKTVAEKENSHYFEVELLNVDASSKLTDYKTVKDYLTQHAPLPFCKDFKWGQVINQKLEIEGYKIPSYSIFLIFDENKEQLFKNYSDNILSDRIKKFDDKINDIVIVPLKKDEKLIAIIWYAKTNFFGTILDKTQKGLRIRQGNILIGDNLTCNQFFKEERFNGWILGEIHILDNNLIANSRRDNFEKNQSYHLFEDSLKEFTNSVSKEIRHFSYERNLQSEKKAIIETDDVNDLLSEDIFFTSDMDENSLINSSESEFVAENDFFNKLSMLVNKKSVQTKYNALNVNDKLTIDQRKTLERVFDLISSNYGKKTAEKFINTIAIEF